MKALRISSWGKKICIVPTVKNWRKIAYVISALYVMRTGSMSSGIRAITDAHGVIACIVENLNRYVIAVASTMEVLNLLERNILCLTDSTELQSCGTA